MSVQEELRGLAARQMQQAPWSYEHFEQRRGRSALHRRVAVWSAALSVSALAIVSGVALLTQPDGSAYVATASLRSAQPAAGERPQLPALVDMAQFDVTSTLEDHIAMLDAELSAGRVRQVPEAQLRPIESAREQLSASLQRVSYAHALLNL